MHQHQESSKSARKYEYSPKIAERRRALFPAEASNNPDDLDDLAPITDGSSDESPPTDQNRQNTRDPKIRTELFPEIVIPPKNFYDKNSQKDSPPLLHHEKSTASPSGGGNIFNRKESHFHHPHKKNKSGEVNQGVHHKVRKPKKHKIAKDMLIKMAENIIDNSPLNEYINQVNTNNEKLPVKPLPNLKPDYSNDAALCEYMKNVEELRTAPIKLISAPASNINSETASTGVSVPMVEDACCVKSSINKRPLSPQPEEETTRKFFKASRSKSGSAEKQTKLCVQNGKWSLTTDQNQTIKNHSTNNLNLDISDLDCPSTPLLPNNKIEDILNMLDNEKENHESNGEKHNHLSPQETQMQNSVYQSLLSESPLEFDFKESDTLMSPTTQMCDMTSGLAIASPKTARNLTPLLNGSSSSQGHKNNTNSQGHKNTIVKRFRPISKDQMLLDAGQKNFGATQCPECKIVYHMGDPCDEIMHHNYHSSSNILRFTGWRNERVVANFPDSRIIHIVPSDSKLWLKKVKDLLEVVNRDLGFFDMDVNIEHSQIFLFIKYKTIKGCLVAEPQSHARRMLDNNGVDLCSEELFDIKCGISRIWVSQHNRKQKVATCLIDCLKKNFLHGSILNNSDIALSTPTDAGKMFAAKYFGTPNFLIYGV